MTGGEGGGRSPAPRPVAVGLVLGAFGLGGEVKVRPLTEFPDRLLDLKEVRLSRPGPMARQPERREVTSVRQLGDGTFIFGFAGVGGRLEAGALRGATLEIEAAEVRPLPPGRFYRFQVLGLVVKDEAGRALGKVADVLETGANDVFVVKSGDTAGFREELLIPALRDVVLAIDFEAGEMTVRPLPAWGEV